MIVENVDDDYDGRREKNSSKDNNEMDAENNNTNNEIGDELDSLDNKQNDTKIFEQIIHRLKYRFRARVALQEIINSLSRFDLSFYMY